MFALEVIAPLGVPAFAPSIALFTHLIIFEDDSAASSHPADIDRMLQISKFYTTHEPKESPEDARLIENLASLFVQHNNGAGYDGLDQWARTVTRDSLLVKKPKTKSDNKP